MLINKKITIGNFSHMEIDSTNNYISYQAMKNCFIMPTKFSVVNAKDFIVLFNDKIQDINDYTIVKLDFCNTNFIDSSGIGALSEALSLAKNKHCDLHFLNTSRQVNAVLKLTGFSPFIFQSKNIGNYKKSQILQRNHLPNTHQSIGSISKRLIDVIGALAGLLITTILFIPIAIAIKIESKGPLFFRQKRVGWLGKSFTIIKFRSMAVDAESRKHEVENEAVGAIFKNSNDPRITRVGQFLRKTSLDELPQFLNVLQGSMSLVGTRPPTMDELDQYQIPHWQRLNVKPGITGEWQVNGRSNISNFEDIINLDMAYQKKWSILYDLKLILRTVFIIFSNDSGAK